MLVANYSGSNSDRGATLPERSQSVFALKREAEQVFSKITCEKFKHRAERREYDETFALLPSLLQGCTSIETVSSGFLVA
jgi:hypothetical protein